MTEQKPQTASLKITTGDEMSRGRFSNNVMITHSPEEFIVDWLLSSPGGTHLVSRVIVTPGHVKRILAAMTDNLRKYEAQYGEVKVSEQKEQKFH